MAQKKETMMMLKVDLDCARCYKKVKKLLCSIPQVKDQIYDEKKNTVEIKVVGCPEKIRDKICSNGGKTIIDIQIIPPSLPDPTPTTTPQTLPKPKPKPTPTPPPTPPPTNTCCPSCCECRTTAPCYTRCRCGCRCGYWYGVPPPPLPGWLVYYDGCNPGGYKYMPSYYYNNCENPSACIIM